MLLVSVRLFPFLLVCPFFDHVCLDVDVLCSFFYRVLVVCLVVADPVQAPAEHPDEEYGWEEH